MLGPTAAMAAPPQIGATWSTAVAATSAVLHAEIDPVEGSAKYHFEVISEAAYQANLSGGKDGFAGALSVPTPEGTVGSSPITVQALVSSGLAAETAYRYRAFAKNPSPSGSAFGPVRTFVTRGFDGALKMLDNRGWEMVSPVDKNGGAIQGAGANAGGDVLQAAAGGESATFSSASSFSDGGEGAPIASQYISRRGAGDWSTENVTAPLFAGGYGENPNGVPYRIFSSDLTRGLLSGVPYPPLAGTGAPAGYLDYYLRDNLVGTFDALIDSADVAGLSLPPPNFELELAGTSSDLGHIVLSSCSALTEAATEIPNGPEHCAASSPNLYEWSPVAGLELINQLPGDSTGTPGASLAASSGTVSADGSEVYWTQGGNLYLREDGAATVQVDQSAGGGGAFQTATPDGSIAFFLKGEHLYRYDTATHTATDLTPGGGVQGMLGASASGAYTYFLTSAGLFLSHNGSNTEIAAAADPSNLPPSTGTARVSADGTRLAFISSAPLTDFENIDKDTHEPDSEIFVYDAAANGGAGLLMCASCNPTNERPAGPSSIPGAVANGQGKGPPASTSPAPCPPTGGGSSSTPKTCSPSRTRTPIATSTSGRHPERGAARNPPAASS